ncbi:MAG TPA: N-acetyl-1-D-myo-inositol-2-amino-2-deoxy-alpha-D-glucopyranoside deacetylase [Actinocrinis sp.]|nr:N-acetyl-1-D-myo-inositol-2-amino-2-deoxy-alpha-D-glucopyranoside deacetylase [Actinocrinis sp.]
MNARAHHQSQAHHALVFVHAHPDDETLNNGATMAKYAAQGHRVTLVTCTLGEEGEVIGPQLAHLAAAREDRLGEYRVTELAAAMRALGVEDHRFLGGPGRYRDSGMMGTAANDKPGTFWHADVELAAGELAEVLREVRPTVLVTYDESGGYGHPDHIQAHRVAMRALDLAADPGHASPAGLAPHEIAKVYWNVTPKSQLRASLDALLAAGPPVGFTAPAPVDELPMAAADETVTAIVPAGEYLAAKQAAMRAHATQISVAEPFYALSDNVGFLIQPDECYRQVRGPRGSLAAVGGGPGEVELDLLAGLPEVK